MLNNNSLALIALCNEYCSAMENASQCESRRAFIEEMLRLLPRLYIAASDLKIDEILTPEQEDMWIEGILEEDGYETVRHAVEAIMGEDDVYLEVFEEDMKYSDTPVSASISEELSDIFQVLYNFTEMVKRLPSHLIPGALNALGEEFRDNWSQPLCNVLRALNSVRYNRDYSIDE